MSLINCIECNREISDKAVACPNCGCPIEDIVHKEPPITAKDLLDKCNGDEAEFKKILVEKYNYYEDEANDTFKFAGLDDYNEKIVDHSNFSSHWKQDSVPKCLTCQSTNIEKNGTLDKIGSVALFGFLASGHINKTFRCKDCNYKW